MTMELCNWCLTSAQRVNENVHQYCLDCDVLLCDSCANSHRSKHRHRIELKTAIHFCNACKIAAGNAYCWKCQWFLCDTCVTKHKSSPDTSDHGIEYHDWKTKTRGEGQDRISVAYGFPGNTDSRLANEAPQAKSVSNISTSEEILSDPIIYSSSSQVAAQIESNRSLPENKIQVQTKPVVTKRSIPAKTTNAATFKSSHDHGNANPHLSLPHGKMLGQGAFRLSENNKDKQTTSTVSEAHTSPPFGANLESKRSSFETKRYFESKPTETASPITTRSTTVETSNMPHDDGNAKSNLSLSQETQLVQHEFGLSGTNSNTSNNHDKQLSRSLSDTLSNATRQQVVRQVRTLHHISTVEISESVEWIHKHSEHRISKPFHSSVGREMPGQQPFSGMESTGMKLCDVDNDEASTGHDYDSIYIDEQTLENQSEEKAGPFRSVYVRSFELKNGTAINITHMTVLQNDDILLYDDTNKSIEVFDDSYGTRKASLTVDNKISDVWVYEVNDSCRIYVVFPDIPGLGHFIYDTTNTLLSKGHEKKLNSLCIGVSGWTNGPAVLSKEKTGKVCLHLYDHSYTTVNMFSCELKRQMQFGSEGRYALSSIKNGKFLIITNDKSSTVSVVDTGNGQIVYRHKDARLKKPVRLVTDTKDMVYILSKGSIHVMYEEREPSSKEKTAYISENILNFNGWKADGFTCNSKENIVYVAQRGTNKILVYKLKGGSNV